MHTSVPGTPHDDPCAICREPVVVGAGGTDPAACALDSCHHRFHCGCILQWAKIANTCPLCKRRFSRVDRLCLRATQPAAKRTPSVCVQLLAPTCCALSTSPGAGEFVAESIHVADRAQRESTVGGLDVESICCGICRSGDDEGELLLCDGGCGGAAHTFCIGLPTVPEGRWYCASCDPDINAARAPRLRTCDHGNTASRQRQRKRARPDDSYPSEGWHLALPILSQHALTLVCVCVLHEQFMVGRSRTCLAHRREVPEHSCDLLQFSVDPVGKVGSSHGQSLQGRARWLLCLMGKLRVTRVGGRLHCSTRAFCSALTSCFVMATSGEALRTTHLPSRGSYERYDVFRSVLPMPRVAQVCTHVKGKPGLVP